MSDFIDKFKGKIDEGILQVTSRSKTAIEQAKLNSTLRLLEKAREEKINHLGNIVCRMFYSGQFKEDAAREVFSEISKVDQEIESVKNNIAKLKASSLNVTGEYVAKCTCGAGIIAHQKYCASCGGNVEKIIEEAKQSVPKSVVCLKCGAEMSTDATFCRQCGEKLS